MRFFTSIFYGFVLIFTLASSRAGVLDQSGFDAWYQKEVAPHVPEPLRDIMNPAAARLIVDEVKLGDFYGPSFNSLSTDNDISYLTYMANISLSFFPNHPTLALIRAFFPCPEGAVFVHAQAISNPLSALSVAEGGKLLNMLMDPQGVVVEKIYGFLRAQNTLTMDPWNKSFEQPLSHDQTINGCTVLQSFNILEILMKKVSLDMGENMSSLNVFNKVKSLITNLVSLQHMWGHEEYFYDQFIAWNELIGLRQNAKNLENQRETLLKVLDRQSNPKKRLENQAKLDQIQTSLERIHILEAQIPDLHVFDNLESYYLSQVSHLLMDAFKNQKVYPLNPNLAFKTFLAFAYSKASSKDDIRAFYEAFLGVSLNGASASFNEIQPFTSFDYEQIKSAIANQVVSDSMATLENVGLYLYGQRAFEPNSRHLLTYGSAVVNEKSFSDCVETSLLNLLILKLQKGEFFDLSKLPENALPALRELLTQYNSPEHFEGSEARNAFAKLVSFIPGMHYVKPKTAPRNKRTFELYAGFLNSLRMIAFLLNDQELLSELNSPEFSIDEEKSENILQNILGDEFVITEVNLDESKSIQDFTGAIEIQLRGDNLEEDEELSGPTFVWNNTDMHSWVEMTNGLVESEVSHPLFSHSRFSMYPEFHGQIMAKTLQAPKSPGTFPIDLTPENVWGVAASLSKQPEMQMWFAWALLTRGPKSHSDLALEMLAKVVKNYDNHLVKYFLKLHHLQPFTLDVQRQLIIKEDKFFDFSINPDPSSAGDDSYGNKISPLLNFLDDPEIIMIARKSLSSISNIMPEDLMYREKSMKLFDMIAADGQPWNIKYLNGDEINLLPEMQNIQLSFLEISNLVRFTKNTKLSKLGFWASFHYDSKNLLSEDLDVLRQVRVKNILMNFSSAPLTAIQDFLGAMTENPHQQSGHLREIKIRLQNPLGETFTPEALNYMNSLREPLKSKVFIQTLGSEPRYEETLTPLVEFFTKDGGAFAKQTLGYKH